MLCCLALSKNTGRKQPGRFWRAWWWNSSQSVAPAIFTPGALELWGCRWPNTEIISSMSLIIYMELITLGWQFLLTPNCRCTKEKQRGEAGALQLTGWPREKPMSFSATPSIWRGHKPFKRMAQHGYSCKDVLVRKVLFLIHLWQEKDLPDLLINKSEGWKFKTLPYNVVESGSEGIFPVPWPCFGILLVNLQCSLWKDSFILTS